MCQIGTRDISQAFKLLRLLHSMSYLKMSVSIQICISCRLTEASAGGLIPGRFSYMEMMLITFGDDPSASSKFTEDIPGSKE